MSFQDNIVEHNLIDCASTYRSPETVPMLSPENWDQILTGLSPGDFHSAINSCPEFYHLMSYTKNNNLFPLVLPILASHLPLPSLLNCRGVTKSLNIAAEKLLSDHLGFRPPANQRKHHEKLAPLDAKYRFGNWQSVESFMSRMDSRPFPNANPFFMGSLSMCLEGRTTDETTRNTEAFTSLFSRHGHYLQKVYFRELVIEGSILETFFKLLIHVPNLRSINILGGVRMEEDTLQGICIPKLEKLEALFLFTVFRNISIETEFCLKLLNQYGQQLTSLSVNNLLLSPYVSASLLNELVPNIRVFEMVTMNSVALKKLGGLNWPLEELDVWGNDGATGEDPTSRVENLLEAVNNFSETLITLKFLCNRNELLQRQQNDGIEYRRLSKLKILTIQFTNLGLDWIWEFLRVGCCNISELNLMTDRWLSREDKQLARGLFEMMPMLKRIVVLPTFPLAGRNERVILPRV